MNLKKALSIRRGNEYKFLKNFFSMGFLRLPIKRGAGRRRGEAQELLPALKSFMRIYKAFTAKMKRKHLQTQKNVVYYIINRLLRSDTESALKKGRNPTVWMI